MTPGLWRRCPRPLSVSSQGSRCLSRAWPDTTRTTDESAGSRRARRGLDAGWHGANHCAAAGVLAHRLGLGDEARTGIEQTSARWDGHGVPAGVGGEELSLAARVSHVAEASEVLHRTAGVDATLEM